MTAAESIAKLTNTLNECNEGKPYSKKEVANTLSYYCVIDEIKEQLEFLRREENEVK